MITYELAIALKEAGFPQTEEIGLGYYNDSEGYGPFCWYNRGNSKFDDNNFGRLAVCPTLSELIEACGDRLGDLTRINDGWGCNIEMGGDIEGKTPEEAVAKLWLKLNEHKTKRKA